MGRMTTTTARHALAWTAVFIMWHGYWAMGGDFGFGDQEAEMPDAGSLFTVVVAAMFAAGIAVPFAVIRGFGPRRLLGWLLWAGAAVLAARGLGGLADDALRFTGLSATGLTGLTDEQVLGSAAPSAYTIWSTVGIDSFFLAGGLLFGRAARHAHRLTNPFRNLPPAGRRTPRAPWRSPTRSASAATRGWAGRSA